MTVCIVAICEAGKNIVVAADRMFTNPGLSVEFETAERKIEQLAERCVAMAAGNSVYATEILEGVRAKLGGNPSPPFNQTAELLRAEYERIRGRKIYESFVASALVVDWPKHQAVGSPLPTYLEKQPNVFGQMMMFAQQFNLQTDFLIAGIDDTGAHLSHVTNPALLSPLQKLGHAAVGTGGNHAMTRLSLLGQSRQRGLLETLADVYSAKKVAEVAPGVGNATDVAVIDTERGVWFCPQHVMDVLSEVHKIASAHEAPNLENLRRVFDEQRRQP